MSLAEQILGLRTVVGAPQYSRPDPNLLETFTNNLNTDVGKTALKYLHKRGLTESTISHFKLGYCPERNAIAIPIFKDKLLTYYKFRNLDPAQHHGAKYGSLKGCEPWIFNEQGIRSAGKTGRIIITEGEFDAMAVWQSGIPNVISASNGKDSYAAWIENLDHLTEFYIAYDSDEPGQVAAKKLAERIDIDKCYAVEFPEGVKDANEYINKYSVEELRKLIKTSRLMSAQEFSSASDVMSSVRIRKPSLSTWLMPGVRMGSDWLILLSGMSNAGKTSISLNIIRELAQRDIPCMVMPFERGIESVGGRFMHVMFDKTEEEFHTVDEEEWKEMQLKMAGFPVYFAVPKLKDLYNNLRRAKRLFDIKFVLIDHLDYLLRGAGNKIDATGEVLQKLKELGMELGIIILVVHHLKKGPSIYDITAKPRPPSLEDIKGSSNTYQDPECVVLLHSPHKGAITIDIAKNKGKMETGTFMFNEETGVVYNQPPVIPLPAEVDKVFNAL